MGTDDQDPFSDFEALEKALDAKFEDSKNKLVKPSHTDNEYSRKRDRAISKRKSRILDAFLERYRAQTGNIDATNSDLNSTTRLRTGFFWTVTIFLILCVASVLAAIAYDSFWLTTSKLNPTTIGIVFTVLLAGLIGLVHLVGKGLFSSK